MKKLVTMIGVAGLAFAATAAVDDALLSFSTVGPDKYADGTDVLPGECYALVWSADGQFEGIKADGTTIDPADKVVLVAPVAKQGANGTCCPSILYQVDKAFAESHASGQYAVYILDTRVKAADGTVAVGGVDENGALKVVNGYDAVSAGTTASSATESIKTVATTAVGGASVATLAEVDAPVILPLHPFQEILRTHKTLFLCTKEHEDNTSWRANLLKILCQFKHNGIAAGIIVGTRVYPQCVRTT